ncbi:excinuclease ABC subunit B [Candidatus Giovannonibacteria bacterium RIFCSPLOWO2_12_FULL_44_25]|uniref:UvrABC system protein B n=2 Tax=Candidatus Giovannoniibacteriota TaxID=1752738 RepID=A0A1F5W6M0_9BACT|nr:MAG: UvrABC system protein B [Parcubacteria group bacterium GW2011_GWC1_44_10]KKT60223.1 MAG: UvrABC system protein B [Candidatus Giovannonibacteria bacterium GW2011_GWA1_44_25]KKU30070.1 MAG: UvrABC system protein B [Candidatus Giovannonibacteria bacterium GW2011_GWB1_46_20]OGF49430.1 MAG: excinuclease ABC subunit B [Candidatus Giovannonibacteria bacterium GWA2_45_15]OGF59889.1 MAG: excinuclease ABC subunit B [Candidatus Giovannonibacteria bacterium RIFCSPHIGHO2_01_45_12]OGF61095.1 MAG: ex
MSTFKLHEPYKPAGDQPKAIAQLTKLLTSGSRHQTLLGVTGSGKTFTMANVIANLGRPALVISHNKTLAAQLYQEFKTFFPENAVHYFVSYYDYYQPEAYIPQSDTYIEKDARINDFIDAMRHATTATALTRRDFVVVASVSCIYGIGDPAEYEKAALEIKEGLPISQRAFLKKLVEMQYERNDYEQRAGIFRVRGETVEIFSPAGDSVIRIEWNGNVIERISQTETPPSKSDFKTQKKSDFFPAGGLEEAGARKIFPAKHFVTPQDKLELALSNIELELKTRAAELKGAGKLLEAQRITQRTNFDLKMLREIGYTHGIENYSRQLSFRKPGEPPHTLLDYLPDDFITFIDESHMSIPQIRGMYNGDRARKQVLVDYGFRLPSAIDNRPLTFEEFNKKAEQAVYVSATPAEYEIKLSGEHIVEQIIRPTGLLDPQLEIRSANPPTGGQMPDVINEIQKRIKQKQRVLVTTLTKRMAEDLADFLKENQIKAEYIHSDIKTLERHKILTDLRKGAYDVIVGINLLREGIDLPEVSLVIILDADKEGFLRNAQTLIQTIGRAARHTGGTVLMYADITTDSMQKALEETERRRKIQEEHNAKHGITPQSIQRRISENIFGAESSVKKFDLTKMSKQMSKEKLKQELEEEMLEAAKELDFEKAAELRDLIKTL